MTDKWKVKETVENKGGRQVESTVKVTDNLKEKVTDKCKVQSMDRKGDKKGTERKKLRRFTDRQRGIVTGKH